MPGPGCSVQRLVKMMKGKRHERASSNIPKFDQTPEAGTYCRHGFLANALANSKAHLYKVEAVSSKLRTVPTSTTDLLAEPN